MSNIINMNEPREPRRPTVTSCPYYLNHTDEAGAPHKLLLTGDETITTICPECGTEHDLEFYDFCSIFGDGDGRILFDSMVWCDRCAEEKRRLVT